MFQDFFFSKKQSLKFLVLAVFTLFLTYFSPIIVEAQSLTQLTRSDQTLIQQAVKTELDFPQRVKVEFPTIKVRSKYALVEWIAEDVAGVMFLEKSQNTWVIKGGDGGVPDLDALIKAGIPKSVASALLNDFWQDDSKN
jgi:hypothetical protein